MLEIEDYYGIDDIRELDRWQREFNIPPTEMAPIIFDHKEKRHLVQALWGLIASGTESIEEARKVSTFNAKSETLMTRPTFANAFLKRGDRLELFDAMGTRSVERAQTSPSANVYGRQH